MDFILKVGFLFYPIYTDRGLHPDNAGYIIGSKVGFKKADLSIGFDRSLIF